MKTNINVVIESIDGARALLNELKINGEEFHPADNAHDVVFHRCNPTWEERDQLNKLMEQMYAINGFDPCEFLVLISAHRYDHSMSTSDRIDSISKELYGADYSELNRLERKITFGVYLQLYATEVKTPNAN